MTSDEIKRQVSMTEVLTRYGIQVHKGMCSCPWHSDRHPSMKVFKDGANCFTCGWNGDIFKLVQDIEYCDFKTAFRMLGGTYKEHKNKASRILSDRKFKALKDAKTRSEEDKNKVKKEVLFCLDILQETIRVYEPFSNTWSEAQNELPQLYQVIEDLLNGKGVEQVNVLRKCESIRKRFLAIG